MEKNVNDFKQRIPRKAYLQDPFKVATDVLLGAYLCSFVGGQFTAGRITELEVYIGAEDKACHAFLNKKTERNAIMFEDGGHAYVYFIYGMYNMFNVVVSKKGMADAILIRSLEPVAGIDVMKERRKTDKFSALTTGPGKLTKALGITRDLNKEDLTTSKMLWISPKDADINYVATRRVGIDYAEEYKDVLWRYLDKDSKYISKKAD